MSVKKVVGRNVVGAFGIICIILLVGLVGAFAYYMPMISQLNSNVTNLKNQVNDLSDNLNAAISSLNATVSKGSAGSRLVMIWNNSDVGFAPQQIGHTDYLPARFSYDVSGFHKVFIYYWLASGSTSTIWDVYFSTDAFQKYVTQFTISSTDTSVLELDIQATYLNVSLFGYAGGVEGYLSLYLYLV